MSAFDARYSLVTPTHPDIDALAAASDAADREAERLCSLCLGAQTPEPFEAYALAEEQADAARRAHAAALPVATAKQRARKAWALQEAERRGRQGRGLARLARENAADLGRWS